MLAPGAFPNALARLAIVLAFLAAPRTAEADAPGPRAVCKTEGLGCEQCWRPYGGGKPDREEYASCSEAKLEKGLVEACHEKQGGGDNVFFCPKGAKVLTRVEYFGCGGCTVGAQPGLGTLLVVVAGLAALVLRRRR